jgi:tRNA (guanine37-N1)-methyltransferase
VFREMNVPNVLLSGNHEEIRKWRRKMALQRTVDRRPDLLEKARLTAEDLKFLEEIRTEKKL